MDLLLSTTSRSGRSSSRVKNNSKQAKDSENSNLSTNSISVEETPLPTSASTLKSDEINASLLNIEYYSQVVTKTESSGAKEVPACFCCFWIFPQSFRGEEKNIHIDRCMEGLGDKDKRFWTRCKGDLKQYRHNFGYSQDQQFPKRRVSKPNKKSVKNATGLDLDGVIEPKEVLKKRGNKKDANEEIETTKPKKRGGAKKKDEDIEISDGEAEIISVEVSKKLKPNGGKQEKEVPVVIEDKKPKGLGYTKIIAVPLVTELIFNPSKEFEKFLRK
jgi:hypothetical protein